MPPATKITELQKKIGKNVTAAWAKREQELREEGNRAAADLVRSDISALCDHYQIDAPARDYSRER